VPIPWRGEAERREPKRPDVVNAMTIDVEDYFHVSAFDGVVPRNRWDTLESRVCANTERVLSLFDDAGVRGTFFVLGWVAVRYPDLVRRIAAQGHEIASHGFAHRLVYDQTLTAFREDVTRAKAVLEDAAATEVHGFRAPSYSITPRSLWAIDILIEAGHTYDASIFPIHHDRYGIPVSARHPYTIQRDAGSMLEVPGSVARVLGLNLPVGGGGYFRILPYAWTRWGLERINRGEGRPAVFYLHPWELDPDQPRLAAGLLSRFRHYQNLHLTERRLRRLLEDFAFAPIRRTLLQQPESRVSPDALTAALPYHW
jgi:polysaccharide deacetylase family protein (PEP-CTERM system associated)